MGCPGAVLTLVLLQLNSLLSSSALAVWVFLASPFSSLLLFMDALRMGWGAHLQQLTVTGAWTKDEVDLQEDESDSVGSSYLPGTSGGSQDTVMPSSP